MIEALTPLLVPFRHSI